VRLIDENGEALGVVPAREAVETAKERGLDLIEVAPQAQPPVCRIMDYGKYKYELGKKERDQHRKQKQQEVKELKLSPRTAEHDFQVRVRRAIEFLGEGDKVKVSMLFKAREITHPEIGRRLMERMLEELTDHATVIKPIGLEGKIMSLIVTPKTS
jgi:translation initiation factor IF-3